MSRPRKPSAVLEASGAYVHDPQRRRPQAPMCKAPLGHAPLHLGEQERAIWAEIASTLPEGLAGDADTVAFEVLVCLFSQFRHNRGTMLGSLVAQLTSLFSKFGLDPASRARLHAPAANELDPLESFLKGEKLQ
jgi:phage terminase small subunit